MNKHKKRGKSLPKSPPPINGISLFNRSKYLVTPKGVYSLRHNRFLKGCLGSRGYLQLWLLCDDGVRRWFGIHRLIGEAFVPNPNKLPVTHHLDHNKLNNDPSNLMHVSYKQNSQFAAAAGRMSGKKRFNGPHHMLGKKLSESTKQKMSEGRQGIKNHRCKGPYYLNGMKAETLKMLAESTGIPLSEIKLLNQGGKLKTPGKKVLSRKKLSEIFEQEQRPGLRI